MKKVVIIGLLAFAGWKLYNDRFAHQFGRWGDYNVQETGTSAEGLPTVKLSPPKYRCDGRQYCSQMTSRAEAEFFTRNCPNTKMDGDHDGIPCENDSRF